MKAFLSLYDSCKWSYLFIVTAATQTLYMPIMLLIRLNLWLCLPRCWLYVYLSKKKLWLCLLLKKNSKLIPLANRSSSYFLHNKEPPGKLILQWQCASLCFLCYLFFEFIKMGIFVMDANANNCAFVQVVFLSCTFRYWYIVKLSVTSNFF